MRKRDATMFALYVLVIVMGFGMTQTGHPILGVVQITVAAAAFVLRVWLLIKYVRRGQ